MKQILQSGYIGFDNAGDEMLLNAIRQQIQGAELVVLSGDVQKTEQQHAVRAIPRLHVTRVVKELLKTELVISGGGSLFQDKTSCKSIFYYAFPILLAKLFRRKVVVYAQGMGPISRPYLQKFVAWIIEGVDACSVRDQASAASLQAWGVTKEIAIVPDPVFALATCTAGKKIERTNTIAFSLRNFEDFHRTKKYWARALDDLARKGYFLQFIPMQSNEDEVILNKLYQCMSEKQKVQIISSQTTFLERWELIGRADFTIGMRLHALIFSAAQGKPFIPISYDPKIDALAAQFNASNELSETSGEWIPSQLMDLVNQMEENYDTFQWDVCQKGMEFRKQSWEYSQLLLSK